MQERTTVPERAATPAEEMQRAARQALAECRRAVRASQRSFTIRETLLKGRAERDASRADRGNRRTREEAAERVARLRPRELEVLVLYSLGLRTEDVASALFVSRHTVRTHVKNALARLEVHARPDAVALVRHASGSADVSLAALRILPELERWGRNSHTLTTALEGLARGHAG